MNFSNPQALATKIAWLAVLGLAVLIGAQVIGNISRKAAV